MLLLLQHALARLTLVVSLEARTLVVGMLVDEDCYVRVTANLQTFEKGINDPTKG